MDVTVERQSLLTLFWQLRAMDLGSTSEKLISYRIEGLLWMKNS